MMRDALVFPTALTVEEKHLKEMHEKLRALRKRIESSRRGNKSEKNEKEQIKKTIEAAEVNTEQLRRKIASGAITVKKVDEKKEFRRAMNVEKRARLSSQSRHSCSIDDPGPLMSPPSATPRSRADSMDELQRRPSMSGGAEAPPPPSQQIYIRGATLNERIIQGALGSIGAIRAIDVDSRGRTAFVWMSSVEEAEKAVNVMDGTTVEGIVLQVAFARRPRPPPLLKTQMARQRCTSSSSEMGPSPVSANPLPRSEESGESSPSSGAGSPSSSTSRPHQNAWEQATSSRVTPSGRPLGEKRKMVEYNDDDDLFS